MTEDIVLVSPRKRGGGRPKGAKNRKTIIRQIAGHLHTVDLIGKKPRQSTLTLVLQRLRQMALSGGSQGAFDEFYRLITKYRRQDGTRKVGVLVAPAEISPEEWIKREQELNKHRKPPAGYRAKP